MHVRKAVRDLQPFRPGQTREDLRRFGVEGCLELGSNENPLGPSPAVRAAMTAALEQTRLYPEPGAPRLRRALATHYGRPPEETIAGAGIDDLLDLTVRSTLDPGDNLVLAHPGFIRYAVAARVLTVIDEAYFEFVDDPDCPDGLDHLAGEKPVLVFRTFSKIHSLAGLRIGFGFGPPELIGYLDRARLPYNVRSLAEALLRRGFILRPLTVFGLPERFFRISPGRREDNEAFLAALDQLAGETARS